MTWGAEHADYDLRQLQLALEAIEAWARSGASLPDLGRLVASLEGVSAALESPDADWARRFSGEVLGLETVYAVRLDRGEELDDEDARIVMDTIETLRQLLASAVDANRAAGSEETSR